MEYSDGMKRLLPILLLVFSVGVGAFDEDDLQQLKATGVMPEKRLPNEG